MHLDDQRRPRDLREDERAERESLEPEGVRDHQIRPVAPRDLEAASDHVERHGYGVAREGMEMNVAEDRQLGRFCDVRADDVDPIPVPVEPGERVPERATLSRNC